MHKQARRLGGFAVSIALPAVVNIAVIPAISYTVGATAWGDIALSQAVATLAGVVVSFGWGVSGPADVARADRREHHRLWSDSLPPRIWLFFLTAPVVVLSTLLLTSAPHWEYAISALTFLVASLTSSWYFVGRGEPVQLFVLDTLPRTIGTLAGTLLLLTTGSLGWYVAIQFLGFAYAPIAASLHVRSRHTPSGRFEDLPWNFARSVSLLHGQSSAVSTAATSAMFVNAPMIALSVINPSALALYATLDKLVRYGLTALRPLILVAQSWIPGALSRDAVRTRALKATGVYSLVSVVAGLVAIIVLDPLTRLLTGGEFGAPPTIAIAFALIFVGISVSQMAGIAGLLSLGLKRALFMTTLVGAVLGVPGIVIGASVGGAAGVAVAVGVVEAGIAVAQVVILGRAK